MQNNDTLGSRPPDRADWSNAFAAVSRLAAIRELALQDVGQDQGALPASGQQAKWNSATISAEPIDAIDPDQLARAVAEIAVARMTIETRFEFAQELVLDVSSVMGKPKAAS